MKYWMMIALVLLTLDRPSFQNAPPPESLRVSTDPETLSLEDKAILSDVLLLQADLGEDVWPGYGQAKIPIIFYNERYEFLTGMPSPPSPWVVVERDSVGGQPYHRRAAGRPQSFAMRVGNGWAGSLTSFESMNRQAPMKIMKIARDYYILLVHHEMFHAFQATQADRQFADALKAEALENRYPGKDQQFAAAWDKEGAILAAGMAAKDDRSCRSAARDFLHMRDTRRTAARLSPDLVAFEQKLEWLEGLAKYVEFRLQDMADARANDPASPPNRRTVQHWRQSDMFRLAKRLGQQNGDLRFYLSGMAQAFLLDRLRPGWKEMVMQDGTHLEDLLREAVKAE